jgi:hypothetical protein
LTEPPKTSPGLADRSRSFAWRVITDWIVDNLKLLITAVVGFALYTLGITQNWWPSPADIIADQTLRRTSGEENQLVRPLNAKEIQYRNDGSSAGKLGESLHLGVTPRLNMVGPDLAGLRLRYGLVDLRSTAGSNSSVTLVWAMRYGSVPWVNCRQAGLQFSTRRELEAMIAKTLNNSIAASDSGGDLICS